MQNEYWPSSNPDSSDYLRWKFPHLLLFFFLPFTCFSKFLILWLRTAVEDIGLLSNFTGETGDFAGEGGDNEGGDEGSDEGGDEGSFGINALKVLSAVDREKELLGTVSVVGGGTGISGILNIFLNAGCLTAAKYNNISPLIWEKKKIFSSLKVKFANWNLICLSMN